MERISEDILEEIRKEIMGKKDICENYEGEHVGICQFFGYNSFFPSWELQITLSRTPVTNVKLSSIRLYEPPKYLNFK